jgi:demethylmenaquinone methyltransferase/2-methoxy-6-polyprenyl-1,4-benzoquinol methylase
MKQEEVIAYFNSRAPQWDAHMVRNEAVIEKILDNAGVRGGMDVLDVACGTGVLMPDYLQRHVHSVTGVDISPAMADRARKKFPHENVHILCADIETVHLEQTYDCCMVYNAFPHFPDPDRLIRVLAGHLKPGGRLSIAHGMSRERLALHHAGAASHVSIELPTAGDLARRMEPWFYVNVIISNDEMYQVCGTKK